MIELLHLVIEKEVLSMAGKYKSLSYYWFGSRRVIDIDENISSLIQQ